MPAQTISPEEEKDLPQTKPATLKLPQQEKEAKDSVFDDLVDAAGKCVGDIFNMDPNKPTALATAGEALKFALNAGVGTALNNKAMLADAGKNIVALSSSTPGNAMLPEAVKTGLIDFIEKTQQQFASSQKTNQNMAAVMQAQAKKITQQEALLHELGQLVQSLQQTVVTLEKKAQPKDATPEKPKRNSFCICS